MKWRLTGRYLVSVVLVVILVILFNMLLLLVFYSFQASQNGASLSESDRSLDRFTRGFTSELIADNGQIKVTEKGRKLLEEKKAWVQVLDETGKEVYAYRAPEGVKKKYTPMEVVNMYKYKEVDVYSTIFISEKRIGEVKYSYFLGFSNDYLQRFIFTFDVRDMWERFKSGSSLLLLVDGLIALLIGYVFSRKLTLPLNQLIDGIKRLANKDYTLHYQPKGIYKDVFFNVNHLSHQLQTIENERKKLDKMREEWIGNISHDIKTPLASIQGFAEMMKDPDYSFTLEEMREYAGIIEKKSLYMKDVIEDLNLSTRLRSTNVLLNRKKVNIVALARKIIIDLLNDTKYAHRNIDFQCDEEVIYLEIDEILIRRAMTNLLYNAMVHNEEDVKIAVSIERKEHTHIRIKDYGKGIKEEELAVIFDRYYRGTNTGESHKGSGLGMAIANDIIRAHGGEIRISSVIDRGTTIEIQL
ncbi:sensor histidine kinase [Pseudobacillus badius]|uniref:sensor histidine kinase n=1 Tax=Bacillus badius TaxID=1455 RepID=UPI0007B06679|nr:HAMP domain-containing sensor histidine kinase [Bacillus badius]KZN98314.1 two-component sensor histidine kinase [Bacillus badius]MED0666795.1 HAMP domain-containing sensor histidine kinase [Bacillus badius]OCS82683.1 two-component sensor histidine kinase [Bacillus badius]OVE51389.1 sensor histidine kinase [Bacillus badius]TDW02491.1 signal transduction histidine kinase [Bacillus badius]